MKYAGYLSAKMAVVAGFLYLLWRGMVYVLPESNNARYFREAYDRGRFGYDLAWTFALLILVLIGAGLLYLVIWDQKRRCRTCLRRLIMPVTTGSWNHLLLIGPPRIEYICPYGHGTLQVPEVQITGPENPNWLPHDDDIWKELDELEKKP